MSGAANLPELPGVTLLGEIARGGMGVVYSGRQDFLDRKVAVKFLSVELGGESFQKRFQREAKILAGISHPNIVACHMAGTTSDGQSYLVMEFINGPSLKAWIGSHGPVAPMASLRLVRAVGQALGHAHLSEIIHRDVKPENILLEPVTSTALDINFPYTPKLVDLGLARMTHEQVGAGLTSPGSVMGTPTTMSPEQFDDPDSVDFRSDIYGLGCVLYEMLVGKPAFRDGKLSDIIVRKRQPVAPNPCEESPLLPAALGAFVQRMLASDRLDRPDSYKQLDREIDELQQVLIRMGSRSDTVVGAAGEDPGATVASVGPAGGGGDGSSAGLLNTGELDFLAEGGTVGAGDSTGVPTAFRQELETGRTVARPPTAGVAEGAGEGASRRRLLAIAAAVVILGGAGAFFALGGDGDTDGGGDDATDGNRPPEVQAIAGPLRVGIDEPFELTATASDPDGDELAYRWRFPRDCMRPLSDDDQATIRLQVDDGLTGTRFMVSCIVSDGGGRPGVERHHTVTLGEVPSQTPLIGFRARPDEWRREGNWAALQDPLNPAASGRAKGKGATLQRSLGAESYWEWRGRITPSEDEDGHGIAFVEIEFGGDGYAIRCERREGESAEPKRWTIELLQRAGANDWQPLAEPVRKEWQEPAGANEIYRAYYVIRRERARLRFALGKMTQEPPRVGEEPPEPSFAPEATFAVDLTDAQQHTLDRAGTLTLRASQGRSEFLLTRY